MFFRKIDEFISFLIPIDKLARTMFPPGDKCNLIIGSDMMFDIFKDNHFDAVSLFTKLCAHFDVRITDQVYYEVARPSSPTGAAIRDFVVRGKVAYIPTSAPRQLRDQFRSDVIKGGRGADVSISTSAHEADATVFFQGREIPPFAGYELWLEEVETAVCWMLPVRSHFYSALLPICPTAPPPPDLDISPLPGSNDALRAAAIKFIWLKRPDLVWQTLWHYQFECDDPDETRRVMSERKYDDTYLYDMAVEIEDRFPEFGNLEINEVQMDILRKCMVLKDRLPLRICRAPWARMLMEQGDP